MRVGLFIPCFMDQLFPRTAMAVVEFLEKRGVEVHYPTAQTCCGQPMKNSGCASEVDSLAGRFYEIFSDYDYVVCPSGSCTSMVRHHYHNHLGSGPENELKVKVYEFCEFIHDVLKVDDIDASFPHQVGLHQSCHGLRELRLGSSSERNEKAFSKVRTLLAQVKGLELVDLERPDECCGFGGTFAVTEESVSCQMGKDRIQDHLSAKAQVITGVDSSCLMHLEGLIKRSGTQLPTIHVAEILNGSAQL